jgi:Glycosyl transferase family 11
LNQKSSLIVPLTGGLGNQLFQCAAGMAYSNERQVIFECSLGRPRLNQARVPQICDFNLPESIATDRLNVGSSFFSKVFGYNLRSGIIPSKFEKLAIIRHATNLLSTLFLSLALKSRFAIRVNRGVGFSSINVPSGNCLLVGYFQSYIWPSAGNVQSELQNISLKTSSQEFQTYRDLAIKERPLVVHIRLGDYKSESGFGIPGDAYYEEAISEMYGSGNYSKIWLFSDEPGEALRKIPLRYRDQVRVVPEISNSASQTLEVMRHGRGYVIANSTFSWWGAFLTYTQSARVIAPSPWFKGMSSPALLIPPNWSVKDSSF